MKAVILAGGLGTRLYPVTYEVPKAMVPIANRPLLERVLAWFARSGVRDVALAVCYRPEAIRGYFQDGREFGASIQYVTETAPLGTGGAVKNCAAFLDDQFVVLNGDILTSLDLSAMLDFHARKGAVATIATVAVKDPSRYGLVESDADGKVTRFVEKPPPGTIQHRYVNAGIYIFEHALLQEMPPPPFSMERDFFPRLLQHNIPLYAFPTEAYWVDVGTAESYRQVHRDIMDGEFRVSLDGDEPQPGLRVGEGSTISDGAAFTSPVLLGRNCRAEAEASLGPYCVLGDGVVIEKGAQVSDSVIWDRCVIGAEAAIRDSIIGNDSTIKPQAAIIGQAIAERTGRDRS